MHLNFFNLSQDNDKVNFNRHFWDKRDILFKGGTKGGYLADYLWVRLNDVARNLSVGAVCVQKTNKNCVSQRLAA